MLREKKGLQASTECISSMFLNLIKALDEWRGGMSISTACRLDPSMVDIGHGNIEARPKLLPAASAEEFQTHMPESSGWEAPE